MTKAFKNNMSPGVPKIKGFTPKSPGVVAPMVAKMAAPKMTPHTIKDDLGKKHLPK